VARRQLGRRQQLTSFQGHGQSLADDAVDLIAGAIDGLGIQAVLEPASFTDARLRRAASAIVESVL